MKRAFTLVELLVVIAIMALMGGLAVSGYRQMRRGMEERGVMQNVNQFIRSAYQRAQIDRQSVVVVFWNETHLGTDSENIVVVGKAIAVRRSGRITAISGSLLFDEFGDLKFNKKVLDEDDGSASEASSSKGSSVVNLYRIKGNNLEKSFVYETAVSKEHPLRPIIDLPLTQDSLVPLKRYAFEFADKKGVDWKIGDAYGFEFAEITLPHGYIFGKSFSKRASNPIANAGSMRFDVSASSGSITVSSLRPDSSGSLTAQEVATSESPTSSSRK